MLNCAFFKANEIYVNIRYGGSLMQTEGIEYTENMNIIFLE